MTETNPAAGLVLLGEWRYPARPSSDAPPTRRWTPGVPGVVTVTVDLDEPDPERQRAWVDNAFDAAGTADPAPEAGLLSARFHLSLDGARVLNLAEWTTAQAHRDAAGITDGFRKRVRGFPGASSVTRRHLPYGHLAA